MTGNELGITTSILLVTEMLYAPHIPIRTLPLQRPMTTAVVIKLGINYHSVILSNIGGVEGWRHKFTNIQRLIVKHTIITNHSRKHPPSPSLRINLRGRKLDTDSEI
jgi:hypothetical protein